MRYDVYKITSARRTGYLIDVQSDFLSSLQSRMVIPLLTSSQYFTGLKDLNPKFEIFGGSYTLITQELASVPLHLLGRAVENLLSFRDDITKALDILLTGF